MKTGPKLFSEEITAALAAPLSREHVKERDQGRNKVSYIEGWHAIAEANRIFGFDGWTRETVMSECCHSGSYEKAVWEMGHKTDRTTTSFRCSYRARVRVTAGGIVREGSGHGHGFSDNPGEAHESAEKEAETDAMKRALMTFGNPFGLALYDKKMENVEAAAPRTTNGSGKVMPPHPEEPRHIGDARQRVSSNIVKLDRILKTATNEQAFEMDWDEMREALAEIATVTTAVITNNATGKPMTGQEVAADLRARYNQKIANLRASV